MHTYTHTHNLHVYVHPQVTREQRKQAQVQSVSSTDVQLIRGMVQRDRQARVYLYV